MDCFGGKMDLNGKAIAESLYKEYQTFVENLPERKPCLAVVLVGDNPASKLYVNGKTKACEKVGIRSIKHVLDSTTSEKTLLELIEELNSDSAVDGILVQLPLPSHIDSDKVTYAIRPEKDVDGFHPVNLGKLMMGDSTGFTPCTPLGIRVMLQKSGMETAGKHAVIIGRSTIVGKPMASLLMQKGAFGDATVTVVHSRSSDLKEQCKKADILIAAVGKAFLVKSDMVKEGAVVIDVGQNRIESKESARGYRLVGDVDYDAIKDQCSLITPVPGGVGPMTIAMLLHNTIKSYCNLFQIETEVVCA